MKPKLIMTIAVVVAAFLTAYFVFNYFSNEKTLNEVSVDVAQTQDIIDQPMTPEEERFEEPFLNPENLDQEQQTSEPYDYSPPGDVFDKIEEIKTEYTGRPDYIYDKTNVEMAKNFGIYETGKKNPFAEIYSLEDYAFDKSIIIPNEPVK